MNDKSWVHYLCFDAYFEDALMKYRASTGLGATYALFNLLNDKLYELGFMDEKGYQYHKEKYGLPLIDEFERELNHQDQTVRLEIEKKRLEIEGLTKRLTNVLNEWSKMKPQAQAYYLNLAKQHSHLPVAKEILKLNEG